MEHHAAPVDSAAAMQGLYQHVKSVYRSVKDVTSKFDAPTNVAATDDGPSVATPRGRAVEPIPARKQKPWGYNSPARQPSPTRPVTVATPKTMPRSVAKASPAAQAAKSPSPSRTPSAEKPLLPLAPRGSSPQKRLGLELTPTSTPIRGGSPAAPVAVKDVRKASPSSARSTPVSQTVERVAQLERKLEELLTVVESERSARSVLEAEVALLKAQQVQCHDLRRSVEEQREVMLSITSQVQFALAWIQQVDRHIAQDDDQRGTTQAAAHSSQTTVASGSPSASQSRIFLDAEQPSAYRLPPTQPVQLMPRA